MENNMTLSMEIFITDTFRVNYFQNSVKRSHIFQLIQRQGTYFIGNDENSRNQKLSTMHFAKNKRLGLLISHPRLITSNKIQQLNQV